MKVAPRWERLARFTGTGSQRTPTFTVAGHALQWRVTATCSGIRLRVRVEGGAAPLAEPGCPGRAFGFSIREGPAALDVDAAGHWEVVVDQQVETPAAEAPLEGMTDRSVAARGDFYGIDQEGKGTARLWRLPGGRLALRLEPFFVTPNTDLYVWVSQTAAPKTSAEVFHSDHRQIAELTASAGRQNYLLPADVDARRVRSVIIWCEPVRTAYAAATLAA
ncbi:MAG: DM13 domain-containing protein [Acidimicrobiia bacterium]